MECLTKVYLQISLYSGDTHRYVPTNQLRNERESTAGLINSLVILVCSHQLVYKVHTSPFPLENSLYRMEEKLKGTVSPPVSMQNELKLMLSTRFTLYLVMRPMTLCLC
jgi:hypothetical protein